SVRQCRPVRAGACRALRHAAFTRERTGARPPQHRLSRALREGRTADLDLCGVPRGDRGHARGRLRRRPRWRDAPAAAEGRAGARGVGRGADGGRRAVAHPAAPVRRRGRARRGAHVLRGARRRREPGAGLRAGADCGLDSTPVDRASNSCHSHGMELFIIALSIIIYVLGSIRILRQYERGVVFLLGKYEGVRGPGITLIFAPIQGMVRVSLRTVTMQIPSQKIITKDNVSIDIAAVAYYHITDPQKAVIAIEKRYSA